MPIGIWLKRVKSMKKTRKTLSYNRNLSYHREALRIEKRGNSMGYKIAVVGATGNVGHEMMNILHERKFPVSDLVALASARSVGKEVSFGDNNVKVQELAKFDF